MTRQFIVLLLVGRAVVAAESTDVSNVSATAQRPNILFILADDVGQEVLECYGGQSYPTPHLNELARTGIKFNHAYSMPVCHPTRVTLMTGKYPIRFGNVTWGSFPRSEEARTFASLMQNAGYATAVAGKWQLCLMRNDTTHARRLGFGHSDLFGWHEGPRYYEPLIYRNGKIRTDTLGHYGPDLYVRSLIEFMNANRNRPFLAFYSMAVAHDVTDDLDVPVPHGPLGRYDSYAEMVAEMDRAVGRLVGALDALKLRERTLILFVADNGTPKSMILRAEGNRFVKVPVVSRRFGKELPGGKGNLTNDGTSVPMIANWSQTIRPGRVVDDLVDFSDFLPTFLELGDVDRPADIDGHSFAGLLQGHEGSARRYAFCQSSALPKPGGVEPVSEHSELFWVRTANWKLYSDGRLYNMQEDSAESSPVVKDITADQLAVREELSTVLARLLNGDPAISNDETNVDAVRD